MEVYKEHKNKAMEICKVTKIRKKNPRTGMDELKDTGLSERSQAQKDKHGMILISVDAR